MGIINRIKQFFGFGKPQTPQTPLPNYDNFLKSEEHRRAKERVTTRYNRPVQPNRTHGSVNPPPAPVRRNDNTDYLSSQSPTSDSFLPGFVAGSMLSQNNQASAATPPVVDLPSEPFTPSYKEPTAPVNLYPDSKPDYQQPETPQRAEPALPPLEREVSSYSPPEPSYHSEPSYSHSDHSSSYSSSSDSSSYSSSDSGGGGDSGGCSCGGD